MVKHAAYLDSYAESFLTKSAGNTVDKRHTILSHNLL